MPYLQRSAGQLVAFIRSRQPLYNWRLDRVWMQHLDIVDRCSYFVQRRVVAGPCDLHLPFLCEMGETFGGEDEVCAGGERQWLVDTVVCFDVLRKYWAHIYQYKVLSLFTLLLQPFLSSQTFDGASLDMYCM